MRISLLPTRLSAIICSSRAAQTPASPQLARRYAFEVSPDSTAEFFDVQRDTAEIYKANKTPLPRH